MALSSPPVLLPSSPTSERYIYPDEPIPSVETDFSDSGSHSGSGRASSSPDEAVFDASIDDDAQSSPDTSPQHSDTQDDDCISELHATSREPSVVYTPKKQRSPFRNPSSVKALQLDTTPPHLRSGSGRPKYNRQSGISRCSTPRSVRSMHSARNGSPSKKPRTEHPLVLLHVTLLPVASPYSQETMEAVLPSRILDNWKLLTEKITETVLERGILIPHPREDYDVMEERLLESLELKVPRILKCGHFHLSLEEEQDVFSDEDEYDSADDVDVCEDCGRRVRDGIFGAGSGQRRWDIKIYASNGLMRAGAWSAAWREMERVDVEILPWIDDNLRRELDIRKEEERVQAIRASTLLSEEQITTPSPPSKMDEQRRREIYGEDAQAFIDGFTDSPPQDHTPKMAARSEQNEPPIMDILLNYVQLLMQDRRNLAIAALSILVLFFAMGSGRGALPPPPAVVPRGGQQVMTQGAFSSEPAHLVHSPAVIPSHAETTVSSVETKVPDPELSTSVVPEAKVSIQHGLITESVSAVASSEIEPEAETPLPETPALSEKSTKLDIEAEIETEMGIEETEEEDVTEHDQSDREEIAGHSGVDTK